MTLPNLIGLQTQVLYMSDNQSLFIKGSAGSGKSLLALYRVYWLAKVHPNENTLLLTFNKAVNVDMQNKLKQIAVSRNEEVPNNLLVYTYHQFMRKVLKNYGITLVAVLRVYLSILKMIMVLQKYDFIILRN